MSTEAAIPEDFILPRPGVAKTLGVCNIVISVLMVACISSSSIWMFMASRSEVATIPKQPPPGSPPGARPVDDDSDDALAVFGLDDPAFVRFTIVDASTAMLLNCLMFATGVGLVNLRAWAARWWTWIAWVKLVRLFLIWGAFIVAVAPTLAERMAQYFVATTPFPPGRAPQVGQLIRVYAVMNLIMAICMIVMGAIYPALSLWIIGRPGVRAALGRRSPSEANPS